MGTITNQVKLDGTKLHKLLESSTTADALITYFGQRGRIRGFTDMKRVQMDLSRAKFEIVEKDLVAFFDELQKAGYGKVIYSKLAGGRPRFIWKVDMRSLANAAMTGNDIYVEPLKESLVREGDASRLRKKQHVGYPVSIMVQRQIQEELREQNEARIKAPIASVSSLPAKIISNTSTGSIEQMVINGETYIKMDPRELEQLYKLREMLKLMNG